MPFFLIVFCLLLNNIPAGAIQLKDKVATPHDGKSCSVCHVLAKAELDDPARPVSGKRKMKKGLNETCTRCHPVDKGHGVGKKTELNRENLPLVKGKITCAVTCHDLHVKTEDETQSRFHLRLPLDRLCTSCHDK